MYKVIEDEEFPFEADSQSSNEESVNLQQYKVTQNQQFKSKSLLKEAHHDAPIRSKYKKVASASYTNLPSAKLVNHAEKITTANINQLIKK